MCSHIDVLNDPSCVMLVWFNHICGSLPLNVSLHSHLGVSRTIQMGGFSTKKRQIDMNVCAFVNFVDMNFCAILCHHHRFPARGVFPQRLRECAAEERPSDLKGTSDGPIICKRGLTNVASCMARDPVSAAPLRMPFGKTVKFFMVDAWRKVRREIAVKSFRLIPK